jgi:hypothetical protein
MEKKVELIMPDGRVVRVMEHQVHDAITKFGASKTKKEVRNVPQELLKIPELKKVEPVLIPKVEADPLPKMEVTEKKERKAPVRSKATK